MMKRRKFIQVICALLYNCNFTGFASGNIYQGDSKGVCVPGLNCYSCPGAVGSCPLGSLQTALLSSKYKFPYYILGMLLLFGVVLGRVVCGFLCPFGLFQELLYLIPSGTLEGGVLLVAMNERLRALIGGLFSWKMAVLAVVIISAVFIFRSFCRFLCPLGAFYALFHRVSMTGMKVDEEKCNGCNACVSRCKLDVKQVGDRECIQCGEYISACNKCALSFGMRKGE